MCHKLQNIGGHSANFIFKIYRIEYNTHLLHQFPLYLCIVQFKNEKGNQRTLRCRCYRRPLQSRPYYSGDSQFLRRDSLSFRRLLLAEITHRWLPCSRFSCTSDCYEACSRLPSFLPVSIPSFIVFSRWLGLIEVEQHPFSSSSSQHVKSFPPAAVWTAATLRRPSVLFPVSHLFPCSASMIRTL